MRFIFAPLIVVCDILLIYTLWHALPWLWAAFLILCGIAVAGVVIYAAVWLALRVGV